MSQYTIEATDIPDLVLIKPTVYADSRGKTIEMFNQQQFHEIGIDTVFVQDNLSSSRKGVLRGIHLQISRPQTKLIYVASGKIFDVAVDLRRTSPTYRKWFSVELSDDNNLMILIPDGFGHGFLCLEDATVIYKLSDFYQPQYGRGIHYSDPDLGIHWPDLGMPYQLSQKDLELPMLKDEVWQL